MELFTPRNVAKYVATAAIHATAQTQARSAIADYTEIEDDNTIVNISTHVFGWYVSSKLKPVTDKMVDKSADFIVAKREARKARREDTTK